MFVACMYKMMYVMFTIIYGDVDVVCKLMYFHGVYDVCNVM